MYAEMHPELLALMQRFELCYELRDSQPPTWLAPQLLPPSKPEGLAEWGQPEDLVLRYCYAFLPKGIISRMTVRLHRFVHDPELAWVTGVLFKGTARRCWWSCYRTETKSSCAPVVRSRRPFSA